MFNKGNKVEKPAYSGLPFYLNILDDNLFAMVEQLTFPIGSRTNWHKNPCGQTILVTKGAMIYQEEGSVPCLLLSNTVITLKANINHWHGAISEENSCLLITYKSNGDELVTFTDSVSDIDFKKALINAK